MVLLVAHVNESKGVGGYAPWIIEPAVGRALRAEGPQEAARRIEHLDPMVVSVGDYELTDPVDRHTGQTVELSLSASVRTKLLHEVSVSVEDLRERPSDCQNVAERRRF